MKMLFSNLLYAVLTAIFFLLGLPACGGSDDVADNSDAAMVGGGGNTSADDDNGSSNNSSDITAAFGEKQKNASLGNLGDPCVVPKHTSCTPDRATKTVCHEQQLKWVVDEDPCYSEEICVIQFSERYTDANGVCMEKSSLCPTHDSCEGSGYLPCNATDNQSCKSHGGILSDHPPSESFNTCDVQQPDENQWANENKEVFCWFKLTSDVSCRYEESIDIWVQELDTCGDDDDADPPCDVDKDCADQCPSQNVECIDGAKCIDNECYSLVTNHPAKPSCTGVWTPEYTPVHASMDDFTSWYTAACQTALDIEKVDGCAESEEDGCRKSCSACVLGQCAEWSFHCTTSNYKTVYNCSECATADDDTAPGDGGFGDYCESGNDCATGLCHPDYGQCVECIDAGHCSEGMECLGDRCENPCEYPSYPNNQSWCTECGGEFECGTPFGGVWCGDCQQGYECIENSGYNSYCQAKSCESDRGCGEGAYCDCSFEQGGCAWNADGTDYCNDYSNWGDCTDTAYLCPWGSFCDNGSCRLLPENCTTDTDCPYGFTCPITDTLPSVCEPVPEKPCTRDLQCPVGTACVEVFELTGKGNFPQPLDHQCIPRPSPMETQWHCDDNFRCVFITNKDTPNGYFQCAIGEGEAVNLNMADYCGTKADYTNSQGQPIFPCCWSAKNDHPGGCQTYTDGCAEIGDEALCRLSCSP